MNEKLNEQNNVVDMAEPIVTEIRKLLTKQDVHGYLTIEEKHKYIHYLNMLGEIYKERCRKFDSYE